MNSGPDAKLVMRLRKATGWQVSVCRQLLQETVEDEREKLVEDYDSGRRDAGLPVFHNLQSLRRKRSK